MIWGQQWDAMIDYFDNNEIDYSAWGSSTQGAVVNSGQSTNRSNQNDKIYNIYDLRTNCSDWTAEAFTPNSSTYNSRAYRGGKYNSYSSSASVGGSNFSTDYNSIYASRLTLYIK